MAKRVKVETLPDLIDTTSSAFQIKKGKKVPLKESDEPEADDSKELSKMLSKTDTQIAEGEYQCSYGAFEGLNPKYGVTLKEMLVNRKQQDSVSIGLIKTSEQGPLTKRLSLTQYQNIRNRS